MPTNTSIETWTREQCEDYLKQYPSSLKSDAVRKRLRVLTPQPQTPQPPKATKIGYNGNVSDVVGSLKPTKADPNQQPSNPTHTFFCKECGKESSNWFGKCPVCGTWNTCMGKTSVKKNDEPKTTEETITSENDSIVEPPKDFFHQGAALVGKILLTALVIALCGGIIMIAGSKYYFIKIPVIGGIGVPLMNKIWN